jgi:hypothetical protein
MTNDEKNKLLKKLFWDYDFTSNELNALLNGKIDRIAHIDINSFYARLLTYTGWYTIIDIIGKERLKDALSDSVIKKIFSRSLKNKYATAKRILYS